MLTKEKYSQSSSYLPGEELRDDGSFFHVMVGYQSEKSKKRTQSQKSKTPEIHCITNNGIRERLLPVVIRHMLTDVSN